MRLAFSSEHILRRQSRDADDKLLAPARGLPPRSLANEHCQPAAAPNVENVHCFNHSFTPHGAQAGKFDETLLKSDYSFWYQQALFLRRPDQCSEPCITDSCAPSASESGVTFAPLGETTSAANYPPDEVAAKETLTIEDLHSEAHLQGIPRTEKCLVKQFNQAPVTEYILNQGYDIRLGEDGRRHLKRRISRIFRYYPTLRAECFMRYGNLKSANLQNLLAIAETAGCLRFALQICAQYWRSADERRYKTKALAMPMLPCSKFPTAQNYLRMRPF